MIPLKNNIFISEMEVFQTDKFYIFVKKENSLWWNRTTSEFTIKAGIVNKNIDPFPKIEVPLWLRNHLNQWAYINELRRK